MAPDALVPLPPVLLPRGGRAAPCRQKTGSQGSQPPQVPDFNEAMHVSEKQTMKKVSGVSWAVYLHILMYLLIKIILGNFISQGLGQIFQLITTGIRKRSADLAVRQHRVHSSFLATVMTASANFKKDQIE